MDPKSSATGGSSEFLASLFLKADLSITVPCMLRIFVTATFPDNEGHSHWLGVNERESGASVMVSDS